MIIVNVYIGSSCYCCFILFGEIRIEIREPTHPQPATVSTKLPNKVTAMN